MTQYFARIVDGIVAEPPIELPDAFDLAATFGAEFAAACQAITAEQAATVREGWTWDGEAFAAPAAPPGPAVPSVTAVQLRLWLLSQGKDDAAVRAAINTSLPEADRAAALVLWDYAATFARSHPFVTPLGLALNFTEAEMDDGFRAAALIE